MRVIVSGNIANKKQIKLALKVARTTLDLSNVKTLEICRVPRKHKNVMRGYAHYCNRRNKASVRLANNNHPMETLSTLLHELCHISQFSTGRMQEYKIGKVQVTAWNKYVIIPDFMWGLQGRMAQFVYRRLPWEREAFAFEDRIMKQITGQTWTEYRKEQDAINAENWP